MSTVIGGARGVVLEILAATYQPLTGNRIAELAGSRVSQSGVSKVLGPLVESGLVTCEPAGSAKLYRLNRDHVAATAVLAGVAMRDELFTRITRSVADWERHAVAVWLFGSAARGSATTSSDIDVFVLRPDSIAASDPSWEAQTAALAANVRLWSGNGCEILEYSRSEFARLVRTKDRIVESLRKDAITLFGDDPHQLISGRQ